MVTSVPGRVVSAWAPGLADADAAAWRRARRVVAGGMIALPVAPLALGLVTGPAVALPAGIGGVGAVTLALAALALVRGPLAVEPEATIAVANAAPAQDALYDLMPGLVTVHDARGQVVSVRGRDRKSLEDGLRSLRGSGLVEQIHVSDRIIFLQAVDRLRQGASGAEAAVRFATVANGADQTGQFLYRKLYLSVLRGRDGAYAGFFTQMLDNGAEEALQRELASRVAEANSANEAKSRFLAAVSHELRTPLNAILGFSDILSGEYFGKLENDRQREYVGLINQSGNHLLAVVNTMLDMSKIEAGHYELICEPFAIAETVNAAEAMLSLQAKTRGVTLTSRVARDAGDISADRRAVQQILINLVGNAIKFTDAGGVVCVDVERRGGRISLSVSDTGIGIPQDKIALLGKPFMQVQNEYSRKYEGTGLGLSLVKGLVALHGGTFTIESRLGEGTVITVTLPADGSGAVAEAAACADAENTVFPPRLPTRSAAMTEDRDDIHEHAKAQTA